VPREISPNTAARRAPCRRWFCGFPQKNRHKVMSFTGAASFQLWRKLTGR
jgi:hypothetical protein